MITRLSGSHCDTSGVSNRRLVPLGLGAVALLAVVALAARGGTLHSGRSGGGPTVNFWDYAFTTLLALEILALLGAALMVWAFRPDLRPDAASRNFSPGRTLRRLVVFIAVLALIFYLLLAFNGDGPKTPLKLPQVGSSGAAGQKHVSQQLAVKSEEIVVVLVLLAVGGAVYFVARKRLGQSSRRSLGIAPETVAAALDESLDDLRSDPDLRRAIVAAYARMERALAVVGMPRDPAEAPLEYVGRVLLSLDTSAGAVRRLTDLFEWARFSHHELEPSMRDDAVDALIAVRDELRNAERQAA